MFQDTISKLQDVNKPHTDKELLLQLNGGGIYFFWMAGCMQSISSYGLNGIKMRGASSGALIAVLTACQVDFHQATHLADKLCEEHHVYRRPLGLAGIWGGLVRSWLDQLLPENAAELCTKKVVICLTPVSIMQQHIIVEEYEDKEDVINACLASVHIPWFMNYSATTTYKGRKVVDGAIGSAIQEAIKFPILKRRRFTSKGANSTDKAVVIDYRHDLERLKKVCGGGFTKLRSFAQVMDMMKCGERELAGERNVPTDLPASQQPLTASSQRNDVEQPPSPVVPRASFSVQGPAPTSRAISQRNNLQRRGDRASPAKPKVSFESTVVNLSTGSTSLLRTESQQQLDKGVTILRASSGENNMDGTAWKYTSPWGHRALERMAGSRGMSLQTNRMLVLLLTFLCYTAYHASRKPPSIVKSVLHGESANGDVGELTRAVQHRGMFELAERMLGENAKGGSGSLRKKNGSHPDPEPVGGWAPFNNPKTGKSLLGDLDLAFLGSYALGMFVSGHLGDRLDLRLFLTGGMLGSGFFVALFGAAYFLNIHTIGYFIFIQICGGVFQATGWPSVVSVMANWFGREKRGLIMGVWNAHTSIGNICGSLIAAYMLQYGWGWSFIVPGAFIGLAGLLIFTCLVVEPQDIGFLPQSGSVLPSMIPSEAVTPSRSDQGGLSAGETVVLERRLAQLAESRGGMVSASVAANMEAHHHVRPPHGRHGLLAMGSTLVMIDRNRDSDNESEYGDREALLGRSPGESSARTRGDGHKSGVGFLAAWFIPGVAVYALTLFFAKLVAYTFLYWLPYYINATEVGGKKLTPTEAGNLSILFDVGGVMGGIVAGYLSDRSNAPAVVSCSFVYIAIPVLYVYRAFGDRSFTMNIALMMLSGFFVNGPYALITTAVSADLGTHSSVAGNEKALATVTAIIDGMGSIGAALGPMATGYISDLPGGFDNVFIMLYAAALCAGLLLSGLVLRELSDMLRKKEKRTGGLGSVVLAADDVVNSATFAYIPPGDNSEQSTIDNETGALLRGGSRV